MSKTQARCNIGHQAASPHDGAHQRSTHSDRTVERLAAGIQTIREGNIFARDAFGAYPSTLCQLSLPTRAQIGKSEFTARYATAGGHFGFSIFTPIEYGIPFGAYPRAIFSYVYRTLMKQKEREEGDPRVIHMGASLRACMNRITGIDHGKITGGPRGSQTLFEKQLESFTRSHMRFFYPRNTPGSRSKQEQAFALFSRLDQRQSTLFELGDEEPRWETHVRASEDLYVDAVEHAVPIDDDMLRALWPSSLRIDQLTWLSFRANELEGKPLELSWRSLMSQFGGGYAPDSHRGFRARFRDGLKAVKQIYDVEDPDCIVFKEDGDRVSITVKRPAVPWADADPRRTTFLPPARAFLPAAVPDPSQLTLVDLVAPAPPQHVVECRRCLKAYGLPEAENPSSGTRCPHCNFLQAFTGFDA